MPWPRALWEEIGKADKFKIYLRLDFTQLANELNANVWKKSWIMPGVRYKYFSEVCWREDY